MKKLFLIISCLVTANLLNGEDLSETKCVFIDTTAIKYYPLVVGNSWTYNFMGLPWFGQYRVKETVTGTNDTNGHRYFVVTSTRIGYSPYINYKRIDSLTGSVRILNTNPICPWLQNEEAGDSLSARYLDSSKYRCQDYYRFTDSATGTYFAMSKKKKGFVWSNYFELGGTRTFARDIGLVYSQMTGPTWSMTYTLTGCVINGVRYGDTSLTGMTKLSNEIPAHFSLFQNYPNPFNPKTNIRFDIPSLIRRDAGVVVLKVYDILGREVQTLVKEQLSPGAYEVEWDGTNYPSGVYYYTLTTGDFKETKRMVLVK